MFDARRALAGNRELAIFARLGELVVSIPPDTWQLYYPRSIVVFAAWYSLFWVALLVGYGLVIPNTRRRATVVIVVLALIAIVVHGTLCVMEPDVSRQDVFWYMIVLVVAISYAAAMVIFGAHRFETLRQEALAARRLGQYQLKELLGRGGMGEVYRAEHLLLRRPCAIKLIRPEQAGDPANLRRFEREVQATATLTNWHTVEIYDYGHAADGTFYYVMEYLPGLTLDQLVSRHGPLPPARAVHLLRQVCVALREAHGIGLIHRDIKPGNIIVGERGGLPDVAKLLDFGLVRPAGPDADADKLTQTGSGGDAGLHVAGTGRRRGRPRTRSSDIYSLGAVAYFLLTGRPPFVGKTALQVLAAHLRDGVRPLTDLRGDCPADLQAAVLRCLEKKPDDRFPDIDHLEQALAGCACCGRWDRAQAAAWWREVTDASTKRR